MKRNRVGQVVLVSLLVVVVASVSFWFLQLRRTLDVVFLYEDGLDSNISQAKSMAFQVLSEELETRGLRGRFLVRSFERNDQLGGIMGEFADKKNIDLFVFWVSSTQMWQILSLYDHVPSLFFSVGSTNPALNELSEHYFNAVPSDEIMLRALQSFLDSRASKRTLLVTEETNPVFSDFFVNHFQASDRLVDTYVLQASGTDVSLDGLAAKVSSFSPDLLYLLLPGSLSIKVINGLIGYPREKILLSDWSTLPEIVSFCGANSYGVQGVSYVPLFSWPIAHSSIYATLPLLGEIAHYFSKNNSLDGFVETLEEASFEHELGLFRYREGRNLSAVYFVQISPDGFHTFAQFDPVKGELEVYHGSP